MATAEGGGVSPWDIVEYEATMLFELCGVLSDPASQPGNRFVANAVVESACLHMRILVDILLSKDSGKGDDIRLNQLVPGLQSPSVNQLKAAYGDNRTENSPCWILNKMVAHPTLKRGTSHDYTDVIRQLLQFIEAICRDIESYQRSLPKPGGGMDPRFCAKTSS